MAADDQRRTRSRTSSSSRAGTQGQGRIRPNQSSYHGPLGTSSRPAPSRTNRRRGKTGGYPLRSKSINFGFGRQRRSLLNNRTLILGALAVVLAILLVVGISSCVRGCSAANTPNNSGDTRIAAGISDELSNRLATRLNRGDQLREIAAHADAYQDQGLIDLALAHPEAIEFVNAYRTGDRSARPYDESVTKGTVPQLYTWDGRWGGVDYAGHPFALTGSGPTSLSMAVMGLLGVGDKSPADIAALVEKNKQASGDSFMASAFVESGAKELGLQAKSFVPNGENITQYLGSGTYLLAEVKANTLTDATHWVLLVAKREDGTIIVHDPTSPEISARPWAAATLAGATNWICALSAPGSESSNGSSNENANSNTGTGGTSNNTSNNAQNTNR